MTRRSTEGQSISKRYKADRGGEERSQVENERSETENCGGEERKANPEKAV